MKIILLFAALVCAAFAAQAQTTPHSWKKIQLSTEFWSEGAHIGDFNKDGKMDVASGPYWYAGPEFKSKHEIYPATRRSKSTKNGQPVEFAGFKGALGNENEYSDNFISYTHDFNGDGWMDYLVIGFPG
ncbi:MAG: VCBS repeat-containing protein, partial [Pedosphaera sp.]|nr:VCBS repeat-containing protein [Pedosphaera sp.]